MVDRAQHAALPDPRLGRALLPRQPARSRRGHTEPRTRQDHQPVRADTRFESARPRATALDPFPGHRWSSHQADQRSVPKSDRGVRVRRRLPRRLPGQGQPAAPPRGRGGRERAAMELRARSGLETGAIDHARRHARGRRIDHLQRLQGLQLHRDGALGTALRQDRYRSARASGRARHRAASFREGRHSTAARRARQADDQRRRTLGGFRG